MTTQNNNLPALVVTMDKNNAKYNHQLNRANERNTIIAELQHAGVSTESIAFRNIPVMFPIVELADLLALKLDGRENFKTGTVESFAAYGTAIQSLAVEGYKKAPLTTQSQMTIAPAPTSDMLLKQSVLDAIEERLDDIRAYMLRCYDSVLANPAGYLADNADNLSELGFISLASYESAFDLPIDRINALLQSEKYRAQIERWQEELKLQNVKATNIRPHEDCLLADVPNPEYVAKSAEIEAAMKANNFGLVVTLGQELLALPATNTIRKSLTE